MMTRLNEPLHASMKIQVRNQSPWELDPASSEGFNERITREGTSESRKKSEAEPS